MTGLRPRDLFDASFRRGIAQAATRNPVLLIGPVGSGGVDLAESQVEAGKTSVFLHPAVGVSEQEIVTNVVAQIVRQTEVASQDREKVRRAYTELARRYGPQASSALASVEGSAPDDWKLVDAIGAGAKRELLPVVRIGIANLHRLPEPVLWELRDLVNDGLAALVATTHQDHVETKFDAESALYGNATFIEVPAVDPRLLGGREEPLAGADAELLLSVTRGRAATIIEVLGHWQPGYAIHKAWMTAIGSRRREAETLLDLAAGVHAYAPRLLRAIADRAPPYGVIPAAPSQRVARALAKLREMDLIEQPAPRAWQIADPLLGEAIASLTRDRRR